MRKFLSISAKQILILSRLRLLNKRALVDWGRDLRAIFMYGAALMSASAVADFPVLKSAKVEFPAERDRSGEEDENPYAVAVASRRTCEALIQNLMKQPRLTSLSFSRFGTFDVPFTESLSLYGSRLQRLSISLSTYPHDLQRSNALLATFGRLCRNLVKLSFNYQLSELEPLLSLSKLTSLHVNIAYGDSKAGAVAVLAQLTMLESLRCPSISLSDLKIVNFTSLTRLKSLNIMIRGVEQQRGEPNSLKWLHQYVESQIPKLLARLPPQIGLNAELYLNVGNGQADDNANRTLMELACSCHNLAAAKLLLAAGADVQAFVDSNYRCQPNIAVVLGLYDIEFTRLLLDNGHLVLPFLRHVLEAFADIFAAKPKQIRRRCRSRYFLPWKREWMDSDNESMNYLYDDDDDDGDQEPPEEDDWSEYEKLAEKFAGSLLEDAQNLLEELWTKVIPAEEEALGVPLMSYLIHPDCLEMLNALKRSSAVWARLIECSTPAVAAYLHDLPEFVKRDYY